VQPVSYSAKELFHEVLDVIFLKNVVRTCQLLAHELLDARKNQILKNENPPNCRCYIPSSFHPADRAYDSAELRQWQENRGTRPVVPNKSNRKQPFSCDRKSCKQHHRIESAFCRQTEIRRIVTRHGRLAGNFLASVCLVAAIVWWTFMVWPWIV
jgi:hypothetical protein